MIALIPICAKGFDDCLLDNITNGIICGVIHEIRNISCVEKIKILSDRACFKLSQTLTRSIVCVEEIIYTEFFNKILPRKIIKNPVFLKGIDDKEDVIIISSCNPLITGHVLDAAVKKFKLMNGGVLVSVIDSSDHPCQLFSMEPSDSGDAYIDGQKGLFIQNQFPENTELWIPGDDHNPAINQLTQKPIKGRQDLPPVYELDGSFLIANTRVLKDAIQSKELPKMFGFVLDTDISIFVDSKLNYLKNLIADKVKRKQP